MRNYLGVQAVADLLGVTRQTIHNRRRVGTFPPPDAFLDSRPGWLLSSIKPLTRTETL